MDADERQFEQIEAVVDEVLGESVVAVYRYGSALAGGLQWAGDLDVFVVTDRALVDSQRVGLIAGLGAITGRSVEVTIAQLAPLVPWTDAPMREFHFGEWLRADFGAGFLSPQVIDHDLGTLVATLLTASKPRESLLTAMRTCVPQLLDELEEDTTNVLLTLARIIVTVKTGVVVPKHDAAQWVLDHGLVHPTPLRIARDIYLTGPAAAPPYDCAEVEALAVELVAKT